MGAPPTGTITFLLTDVEGSTRLWEDHPADAGPMLARHDELFDMAVVGAGGFNVRPRGEGDSRFAVFARATDAVRAALEFQQCVSAEVWARPLRVRAALNTGEADLRDGDYYGASVNRCARIRAVAHGGQTLLSESTADLVSDSLLDGATLRDLGSHRLKDLSRPQRLFQVSHRDLQDEFPRLASLDQLPTNLPAQLTSFVGREHEVGEVRRLLEESRLVTLTGAGGVGKTRLAMQVAADLVGANPNGVWFADLARVSDPDVVPAVVARAVGAGATEEGITTDVLARYLGAGGSLILLDNCEHLLAACADLAEALLMACPALRILATAREALGVTGEVAWTLPSLSLSDSADGFGSSEAVRLFVDRARVAAPDGDLSGDLEVVTRICRRLDGIPLAIELAATRVPTMSPAEIAARLDDRFRLLVGGRRAALERQQTLRATIDWSHEPLDPAERALFRRVSVFAGGFRLDAAESVCAGGPVEADDIVDLVRRLAEKSLLLVERSDGATRHRMLETIRQYAREKLVDSGESPPVHEAHRDYFLGLVERAEPELFGADQVKWFGVLGEEEDNLRAALEWTEGDSSGGRQLLRFAKGLYRFWAVRDATDGLRWTEAALAAAPDAPPELRAQVEVRASELALANLDVEDTVALHHAAEALRLARSAGDQPTEAWALAALGLSRHSQDPVGARDQVREAVSIAREAGDPWVEAHVLSRQAGLAFVEDDVEAVQPSWNACLAQCRRVGDHWTIARIMVQRATLAVYLGDSEGAARMFGEAIATRTMLGDESGAAALAVTAAWAVIQDRGAEPLLRSIDDATATARRLGDQRLLAGALSAKAMWALTIDDLGLARAFLDESEATGGGHALVGFRDEVGARLCRLEGDVGKARRYAQNQLAYAYHVHTPLGVAETLDTVAPVTAAEGFPETAARLFGAAAAQRRPRDAMVHPGLRTMYDADVAAVRAALGQAFERAWSAGEMMTLDQAVAEAVGCLHGADASVEIRPFGARRGGPGG